ncbi:uncharacterized protein C8A04DRAFT_14978 [Dichotomopilus funicola]|uniref:Uncharacterized protein n=1 Tax=Dichotomopilus funicola TaxID=1934379 RepID=A0AAN6UWQ4_9PEZI|nr:hypothetical protein C8A04DRAFT_14978 [Dichotomopilus funicola]
MTTGHQKTTKNVEARRREQQRKAWKAGRKRKQPPAQYRLRTHMPRAGMIYYSDSPIMNNTRKEYAVAKRLKRVMPDPKSLDRRTVDATFAQIFKEAKAVLQKANTGNDTVTGASTNDPIAFIIQLKASPALKTWTSDLFPNHFIPLFLLLRGARQKWHKSPRAPFNVEEHTKTARAIDEFEAVSKFVWNTSFVAFWLIRAGLIGPLTWRETNKDEVESGDEQEERGQNGNNGNSGDDDNVFVVGQQTGDPGGSGQDEKMNDDDVLRAMNDAFKQFGMDFAVGDLQDVLARLRIQEEGTAAAAADSVPGDQEQQSANPSLEGEVVEEDQPGNPSLDEEVVVEEEDRDGDVQMADA